MNVRLVVAGALVALAAAGPSAAQGNSGNQKTKTPNRTRLLTRGVGTTSATTPVALVDDASLLDPGSASLTLSVMRWQGAGLSQVEAPVLSGAVGVHPRVHIAASVPRLVGSSDPNGSTGGLGTVFLSAKIRLFDSAAVGAKLAVSPTVAVLSEDALASMPTGSSRGQVGIPLSVEVGRGPASVYASAGYYSNGSWFAGLGTSLQATSKVSVSLGFSRAWTNTSTTDSTLVASDRNEVSFGVSRAMASLVSVYGSIGQTVATLDENGAGTTLAAGVSLFLPKGALTR
ncbi:MAG: hypothetical protein WBD07_09795 [Vicinamibacterales bacterium]